VALGHLQIGKLAHDAGFSGDDIYIAIGVALAESSGDPGAVGDGGESIGLWQIHRPSWPTLGSVAELKDPAHNARAAKHVRNTSRGWSHWTMYRNGEYRAGYDEAKRIVSETTGLGTGGGGFSWDDVPIVGEAIDAADAVATGVEGVTDALGALGDALGAVRSWVTQSHNWLRVGLVVGGGALTIIAVSIVAKPVAAEAGKVAPGPAGKALRAVS
jgi:hypothetical protein